MNQWPIYFKDRLHVANLQSSIAIVTLWTPMEAFIPKVNQKLFCIAGQLYSNRGINFLLRNIAANPTIDTILICGADLGGSAKSLKNLIDKGITHKRAIVDADNAFIEEEISNDFIEKFRKNVSYIDNIGNSSFAEIDKILKNHTNRITKTASTWYKKTVFPEPQVNLNTKFPSEKATFTIRSSLIKEAWPQIIRHVMKFGSIKGMIKVGEVKELTNVVTIIENEDPDNPQIPDWFTFNKTDLQTYYKNFFAKETKGEDYNYGERIFAYGAGIPYHAYNSSNNKELYEKFTNEFDLKGFDQVKLNQLEEVYKKLKREKYDRGSVISLWNPWKDNLSKGWMSDDTKSGGGNVPCMTQLQFAYRNHMLHLTAYFRSNDMFDAWPRNAFALRKLQYLLSKKLDIKPGYLTTISSLAQIYEGNYKRCEEIMDKFSNITNCKPDQRGTVIIEVEGKEIVVRHMDTSGNMILQEYKVDGTKPLAAQKMSDLLMTNLVFSELPHAMDIARELQKAEIAIKNNLKFRQDRDLTTITPVQNPKI